MTAPQAHRCAHCSAPLEIVRGAELLVCRFCGTHNELPQRPAPSASAAPRAAWRAPLTLVLALAVVVVAGGLAVTLRGRPAGGPSLGVFAGPLVLTRTGDAKIGVEGQPSMYIDVSIFEGTYQLTFHGFPAGTRWKTGARQGVLTSRVYEIVKLQSIASELGSVPATKIKSHPLGPKDELAVELPSGQRGTIALEPVPAWSSIVDALRHVENGPVRFEPDAPPRPGTTSVGFVDTLSLEVFGPAEMLRDLDEIAVPHRLSEIKAQQTCSGYKDAKGKPRAPVKYVFKETEVLVFDRRTGAQLARKLFSPEIRCPMFHFSVSEGPADSYPASREIHEWLKTRVRRGSSSSLDDERDAATVRRRE